MAYNWSTGNSRYNFATGVTAKASEPINSRAEDYKSPGDNSSPAGETISAGIGTSSYDGKIVWWSGFDPGASRPTASFVMVFKDCLFADSFKLVKLFADEQLIISKVAPLRQSGQAIRFYDGTQTTVDPVLTAALGADKASAWPGYVYAVFEDFDCSAYGNRVPLIRAVLAGSVTEVAGDEDQSTLSFGSFGVGYSNTAFTVDPAKGHHYQIVSNGNHNAFVVTIDIATLQEINRVPVFGIANYGMVDFPVALYGTDYIACSISAPNIRPALLNVVTGELVASLAVVTHGGGTKWELSPKRAALLQSWGATKFLVITEQRSIYDSIATGSQIGVFVADVTNETLEYIIHPQTAPAAGAPGNPPHSVEIGPTIDGVMSIWYTDAHAMGVGAVNVALVSDVGFTSGSFYVETVSGKGPRGVAYDPLTSVLVVYRADGSFVKLNAVTGAVLSTHAGAITNFNINLWADDVVGAVEYRAFYQSHRSGYTLATRAANNGDIYEINLSTLAATLLIDQSDFSNYDAAKYFDQYQGWMTEGSSTAGVINRVTMGDATPNSVDLVDFFTQLSTFDARFSIGDLTFTGFPGNEAKGLKLENDTTIDNLEDSIAELFDVKKVESDGRRKYIYPPRDGSFAIDVVLSPEDFVEDGSQTVEKTFGAGEDEFVGCSVSYFDVDADYKKIEQSYNRPVGVYDVTRSKKKRTINTVLSLTASQALRLATLAVYRSVLGNENYAFGLVPGMSHIEPADILQFDFRGFTTITRIKEASLNADRTQDVLAYQYLQYEDATYTGASLPAPTDEPTSLFTRLIYLDLPLLSYSHDLGGAGLVQYAQLAGYGSGAVSGTLYKSADGATFASQGARFGIAPVVGTIKTISGTPANPFVKDETNSIEVMIGAGNIAALATITDAQFSAGTNVAAIGRNGRWVLIWFQTVSSSSGTATLSNLMWGVRGSEVWMDDLAVGDLFVLISPEHYTRFRNDAAALDASFFYKAANPAIPLDAIPTASYAASGVAETPYAPTNLVARISGSDIAINWDYRSRLATGINPANHGEASLLFEIDVMVGETVARTLTATTNSKIYTAADIATDFGSLPSQITLRGAMMSAVVGRGYVTEATISLQSLLLETGDKLTLESGDDILIEVN